MAVGCRSQQAGVASKVGAMALPPEYELTRFRRKDTTKEPIVTGHIDMLQNGRLFPTEWVSVCVDQECAVKGAFPHSDPAGNYTRELPPGPHQLLATFIGLLPSVVKLQLAQGDSVRLNFHLRADTRPTTN